MPLISTHIKKDYGKYSNSLKSNKCVLFLYTIINVNLSIFYLNSICEEMNNNNNKKLLRKQYLLNNFIGFCSQETVWCGGRQTYQHNQYDSKLYDRIFVSWSRTNKNLFSFFFQRLPEDLTQLMLLVVQIT